MVQIAILIQTHKPVTLPGSIARLKRSFARLDDYAREIAYKRVTFMLKQVSCRLIGMTHRVVHNDTCPRRRIT